MIAAAAAVLPRSLDPLPQESLAGYLLRLAHRLDLSPSRIVDLTGLADGRHPSRVSYQVLVQLSPPARASFATVTRLTPEEAESLTLSSFAGRYPLPDIIANGNRRGKIRSHPWVLAPATRCCPRCLAGGGSPIQVAHGGPWRRTWHLATTFACVDHRTFLIDRCPTCGQPIHLVNKKGSREIMPLMRNPSLHPAQCRSDAGGSPLLRVRPACGARLDAIDIASKCSDRALLDCQARLLRLLDPDAPLSITSCGQPTSPAHYFTDLRLVTSLVKASWPALRDMAPSDLVAEAIDDHVERQQRALPDLLAQNSEAWPAYRLLDTPPRDMMALAGLLTISERLLGLACIDDIGECLQALPLGRMPQRRKTPWLRLVRSLHTTCSEGLREACHPLVKTVPRIRSGQRFRRGPTHVTVFGPEHVPAFLPSSWHERYFRHLDGISSKLLRRVVVCRLIQMISGGGLGEAAEYLGIRTSTHRGGIYAAAGFVHTWARNRPDPREFDRALDSLTHALDSFPDKVNYHRRRNALSDWALDQASWESITSQLPPTIGTVQPDLGDQKRQFASIAIWTHLTQGEYQFAPRPIEAALPSDVQKAWHHRHSATWYYYRHGSKKHYVHLKELLLHHANRLASSIDRG